MSTSFQRLRNPQVQSLGGCIAICKACETMCIHEGHKKTALLCGECADICDLTFRLISSDSSFAPQMTELCARVCRKCAEECRKMDAKHCQECADICEQCSDACSIPIRS